MFNIVSLIVDNGIWPWLFDHNDDIGVFLRLFGRDLIRWYAVCILTGAYLCLVRCRHELKKRGMPEDYYDTYFISVLVMGILGCRVWYILSEPEQFIIKGNVWGSILAMIGFENGSFSLSGLAIQGGVLFGLLWTIYYFKKVKTRYPLLLHIDLIAPSVFIGQILGRWGNFFNGEVYGKVVDRAYLKWWIPSFIIDYCTGTGSSSQIFEDKVHIPLFYIEGLLNLVGFILIGYVIWRFWKGKFRKPGMVGAMYFLWYGVVRICLEPLRDSKYIMTNEVFGVPIRTSILMSSLFIILSIAAIIALYFIYRKTPFEKIYINEKEEAIEAEIQRRHDEELNARIAAKKKEILERKAKEKALAEKENN